MKDKNNFQNPSLMTNLSKRIAEIEWFAKEHQLRLEPHLYPKGLFRTQQDPLNHFQLHAYIEELRADLAKLSQLQAGLIANSQAEKLLQKITVLVNTFHSQHLRKHKSSPVEALLQQIDTAKGNAYQQLSEQNKIAAMIDIKAQKQLEADKQRLQSTYQEKQRKLDKSTDFKEKNQLKNTLLDLGKQLGLIEKRLDELKSQAELHI